jgi:hypothetical protein
MVESLPSSAVGRRTAGRGTPTYDSTTVTRTHFVGTTRTLMCRFWSKSHARLSAVSLQMMTGPYPVKYAREWIEKVHRRIPELTGAMWCVGLWDGSEMRGLAVVGRPSARMLDVPARTRLPVLEVIRVAVVEGTKNGCSTLYGACARSGRAMGLDGMLTYIHDDETGVSLRAAGWGRGRLDGRRRVGATVASEEARARPQAQEAVVGGVVQDRTGTAIAGRNPSAMKLTHLRAMKGELP